MLKPFENHPDFSGILMQVRQEYDRQGVFFLEEAYLRQLNDRLNLFPRTIDDICRDAASVRADSDAAKYALFVCRAMTHRALFRQHLALFTFPEEQHPFFALLCLIPTIPALHVFLQNRNIPQDVIRNTLGQFEACVFIYQLRFDRLGLNKRYFDWLQHYVDHEILNINRLRFEILTLEDPIYLLRCHATGEPLLLFGGPEMNAAGLYAGTPPQGGPFFPTRFYETPDAFCGHPVTPDGRCREEIAVYSKAEYSLVLKPGDTCLSVHIPNEGTLSTEACQESYRRAKAIFAAHFPELTVKAFHCHSWMMAPELSGILKPGSRIVEFAEPYLRYPIPTQGEDVLNFVFLLKGKTYADLPEDTSLQRALKQRYLRGEYLYEYGGIFPI